MALIVSDTFTDPNGTLIENHTPELGGAWNHEFGSQAEIQGNKAYQPNGVLDRFINQKLVLQRNGDIESDFALDLSVGSIVEIAFVQSAISFGNSVSVGLYRMSPTNLQVRLREAPTTLGTYNAGAISSGSFKLEVKDKLARAYLNGVVVIDWETVDRRDEGYAGFILYHVGSSIDNLNAVNYGYGAVEPLLDFVTPRQMGFAKKMIKNNKKISINPVTGNIVINKNGRVLEIRHTNTFNIYKRG